MSKSLFLRMPRPVRWAWAHIESWYLSRPGNWDWEHAKTYSGRGGRGMGIVALYREAMAEYGERDDSPGAREFEEWSASLKDTPEKMAIYEEEAVEFEKCVEEEDARRGLRNQKETETKTDEPGG